jgi:hypothetical protein
VFKRLLLWGCMRQRVLWQARWPRWAHHAAGAVTASALLCAELSGTRSCLREQLRDSANRCDTAHLQDSRQGLAKPKGSVVLSHARICSFCRWFFLHSTGVVHTWQIVCPLHTRAHSWLKRQRMLRTQCCSCVHALRRCKVVYACMGMCRRFWWHACAGFAVVCCACTATAACTLTRAHAQVLTSFFLQECTRLSLDER